MMRRVLNSHWPLLISCLWMAVWVTACSSDLAGDIDRLKGQELAVREAALRKMLDSHEPLPQVHHALAKVLLAQNKPADAEKEAVAASEISPFNAAILETLGDVYLRQDKRYRALTAYNQALELEPRRIAARIKLAQTYILMGAFDSGIAQMRNAIAQDDNLFDAHYQLARMLFDRGKYAEANTEIDRALNIDPSSLQAKIMRVRLARATGNYAVAMMQLQTMLSDDPENRDLLREKLDVLFQRQEWKQANDLLTQLETLGPLNAEDKIIEAELTHHQGKKNGALEMLRQVQAEAPDNLHVLQVLGRRLTENGYPEQALEALALGLDAAPDNQEMLYWKAVALYRMEEQTQGDLALTQAEAINTTNPRVRLLRIRRLVVEHRMEEARNLMTSFLKDAPDNLEGQLVSAELLTAEGKLDQAQKLISTLPSQGAGVAFARARLAYLKGQYRTAIDLAKPFNKETTPPWEMVYVQASALARLGELNPAIDLLKGALSQTASRGAFHVLLGNILMLDGRLKEAERVFSSGLTRYPRNLALIEGATRVYVDMQNWVAARDLLEIGQEKESRFKMVFLERLVTVYRGLNNTQKAKQFLERYQLENDPLVRDVRDATGDSALFRSTIPYSDIMP